MNEWAANHPEEYAEIAALPPSQQNAALRDAIGYDPDAIRDRLEEDASTASPEGVKAVPPIARSASSGGGFCGACGAPADAPCASWCRSEQVS